MLEVFDRGYKDHLGRAITGKMPIANQGDKGTYWVDYEVFFGLTLSFDVSIQLTAGSSNWTLNGATWGDIGITSGDTIVTVGVTNTNDSPLADSSILISLVNGNVATLVTGASAINQMFVGGTIYVVKSPQAVKTWLNLLPKEIDSGLGSMIDTTSIQLVNDDISGMSVSDVLTLLPIGSQSGGGVVSTTIERLADRRGGNAKAYRIEFTFYWWLFLTNYKNDFFDVDCVSPYVETKFLPLWNNPAVSLTSGFKPVGDGNSGFSDENFNQNPNNFIVDSMTWSDGANTIAGFDYSKVSEFEIKVTSLTGGFGNYTGLIFFNDIQDKDKYSSLTTNNNGDYSHLKHTIFAENALIDTVGTVQTFDSFIGVNGEKLTISASATVVGSVMTIIGATIPNAQFTTTFEDENNDEKTFKFLVREESASFGASNYSDTVNLTAWRGIGESYPPILGGYFTLAELYDHADNLIHTY